MFDEEVKFVQIYEDAKLPKSLENILGVTESLIFFGGVAAGAVGAFLLSRDFIGFGKYISTFAGFTGAGVAAVGALYTSHKIESWFQNFFNEKSLNRERSLDELALEFGSNGRLLEESVQDNGEEEVGDGYKPKKNKAFLQR